MIVSLVKWRKRFKFIVMFVAFSYALYMLLSIVRLWLEPPSRYREPSGSAVKVIQQEAVEEERMSLKDRLLQFYRYGE